MIICILNFWRWLFWQAEKTSSGRRYLRFENSQRSYTSTALDCIIGTILSFTVGHPITASTLNFGWMQGGVFQGCLSILYSYQSSFDRSFYLKEAGMKFRSIAWTNDSIRLVRQAWVTTEIGSHARDVEFVNCVGLHGDKSYCTVQKGFRSICQGTTQLTGPEQYLHVEWVPLTTTATSHVNTTKENRFSFH